MQLKKNNARTGRTVSDTRIVSIRLPNELADFARKVADREGSSVSALVEASLSKELSKQKKARDTAH